MTIYEPKPAPTPVDDTAELSNADIQKMAGGYPHTPDDVRELDTSAPTTRKEALKAPEPKKRFWTKGRIIGGVVVGALTAGGGTGAVILANQPAVVEPGDPSDGITDPITEPDNGEGTPVTGPEVPSVESLIIPEGLSDEALGKLIIEDRLSIWINSGFNDATYENWQIHTNDDSEFVAAAVAPYDAAYRGALYTDDIETNFSVEDLHFVVVGNALNTNNPSNGKDLEPYSQKLLFNTAEGIEKTNTQRTIIFSFTTTGNSGSNRVGEDFGESLPAQEGVSNTLEVTLVKQADGTEKISRLFKG